MANFAEQLAYWYLRLNGFFLVENYVYHRVASDGNHTINADADLLAIRPPYYYEEIPHLEQNEQGRDVLSQAPLDSDKWLGEFTHRWLGVICEVKGSEQVRVSDIQNAFTSSRIRVSLNRIRLIPNVENVVEHFAQHERFDSPTTTIIKLVFSPMVFQGSWVTITLSDADRFIVERMTSTQNYLAKFGSRYFFPSELIQYMIFSAGRLKKEL
ncbi:MAG: hypothetical protein KBF64_04210 [Anaerolineaceae bacterium]|nr:hypothetical protein [Anaerolineaceae bacterium]